MPYFFDSWICFGVKADAKNQRRRCRRDPQSVDRELKEARIRPDPEITLLVPFQIVGAAGELNVVSVCEFFGGIRGIPGVAINSFRASGRNIKPLAGMIEGNPVGELDFSGHSVE